MEVDPVQQRTGDLLNVLLHLFVRAGALPGGVAPPAALAGIHGAHQLELGGEPQGAACPCHGDDAVLQGLTESLQHVPVKFRQLVQKQHAVVGQRDLAGPHQRPAAGQRGGGGGVVRGAEGPLGQQRVAGVRQSRHGPDAGGLQRFGTAQLRQDRGQPLGQHGFARAGGANQQKIMSTCRGDLQCPLYMLLSHHVLQVRQAGFLRLRYPDRGGGERGLVFQMGHQCAHVRNTVDGQALRQRCFGSVVRRDVQRPDTCLPGGQRHGQYTADAPQSTGET